jgi:hypothetical protein
VNRTYVNARVNNAVTVVQRETFGTGRRVPVRVRENPFEVRGGSRQTVNIVPPRIKPKQPVLIVPPEMRDQMRQRRPERERMPREIPETRHIVPPVPSPGRPEQRETPETRRVVPAVPPTMKPDQPVAPPLVRPRPEQQLPPERVRKTRPEELKNERPLVKQRESSVFRPQQPQNLPVKKLNEPKIIKRKPGPPPQGEQPQKLDRDKQKEKQRQR